MDDRRRFLRAVPECEVVVRFGGNRTARILDISFHGACLELATALSPNSDFRFSLLSPDGLIRVRARVVRCRLTALPGPGSNGRQVYSAAVEFVDLQPRTATAILSASPSATAVSRPRSPVKRPVKGGTLERDLPGGAHGVS